MGSALGGASPPLSATMPFGIGNTNATYGGRLENEVSNSPLYPKGSLVRFREGTSRAGEVWVVDSVMCGSVFLHEIDARSGRRIGGIVADGVEVEPVGVTL